MVVVRVEVKQKGPENGDLNTGNQTNKPQFCSEDLLPCPYRSSLRHPHVANPAPPLRPMMEIATRPKVHEADVQKTLVRTEL